MHNQTTTLKLFVGLAMILLRFRNADADEKISYRRQIAPVLQTYCLGCHNRIEAEKKLSLQSADDILRGSEHGQILDVEHPEESRFWKVLISKGDDHMPPVDEPQLSAEDLATIQAWLREGATFDSRAAVMAALPDVKVSAESVRNPVLSMAISNDGSQLAIGRYKTVEILSAGADQVQGTIVVHDGKVNDVQFSADGKRVLIATGVAGLSGRAVVADVAEHSIVQELAGHNDVAYAAVWSPDQQLIATAGYDRRILVHNPATGKLIRELNGHNGAIFDLQFSPDNTLLASASADGTIKVWLVATGERLDTLSQPQAEQYSVRFSPDGSALYGSGADNRIRKWNLVSKTTPVINPLLVSRFAHEGVITSLTMSTDGRLLATAEENGIVKIWDAARVHEIDAIDFGEDRATCFVFTTDASELVIGTSKGSIRRVPVPPIPDVKPTPNTAMVAGDAAPAAVAESMAVAEAEPNDISMPQAVSVPATITGLIHNDAAAPDQDVF